MCDSVYLEACEDRGVVLATPHTVTTLFLLEYLHTQNFKVYLIDKSENRHQYVMRLCDAAGLPSRFIAHAAAPAVVQQCSLPALVTVGDCVIRCGLGNVLRQIVKKVHALHPAADAIKLLGFRCNSLKACAETSGWTKFCEVEMPAAILQLESNLRTDSNGKPTFTIPLELLKMENDFYQPPIIHNIDKLRDGLLKKKREALQTAPGAAETLSVARESVLACDEMRHVFAEGTNMTLADLVLYPYVTHILHRCAHFRDSLEAHLPNICQWRARMHHILHDRGIGVQNLHYSSPEQVFPPEVLTVEAPSLPQDLESINVRERYKKKFKAATPHISSALEKIEASGIAPSASDHPVSDLSLPWSDMHPAVHPKEGELPPKRLLKKCQQLESLVAAVRHLAKPGDVLVDFCAGGGHVGILAAYLLPQCQVILIENKDESIRRAKERIETLQLENIKIFQCNMVYFRGVFDVGVCLHACGVAADLVLDTCIHNNAAFVICPCCYGKITQTDTVNYPRSQLFTKHDITYKECVTLGHAADHIEKQGKYCMQLVDTDRRALAQQHGYEVTLCSLHPTTCSPKNDLLIGYRPPPHRS